MSGEVQSNLHRSATSAAVNDGCVKNGLCNYSLQKQKCKEVLTGGEDLHKMS